MLEFGAVYRLWCRPALLSVSVSAPTCEHHVMTRLNFREISDRFGHIDGQIASAEVCSRPQDEFATVRIVLRLYPWWEHPRYLAARDAGADWGFDYSDEALRNVVIEAVTPLLCELRAGSSATDLAFYTEHPVLWEFEDGADIVCNSDFEPRELIEALLTRNIPHVTPATLLRYLFPYAEHKAPYSLGHLPFTLFQHVKSELRRMEVGFFVAREPEARPSPVALSIDDNILIVAQDFFFEVPEFEHRPEWFESGRPEEAR
jgi:hypothetical protein